jgi:hypothetical protein
LILLDVFHHLTYPGTALKEFHRVLRVNGRVIILEPAMSLLGKLIYGLFHHEPLGLLKPISWFAPDGVDPKEIGYYAAQANASRVFLGNQFKGELSSWDIPLLESFSDIAYVASGGFSKPQFYPSTLLPIVRGFEKILALWPDLFATRLLVVLAPVGGPGEEVHPWNRPSLSKAALILIVCIFLAVIGGGIWKRTHMAVAPPIYDPISYYCRAELVWSALAKGDIHGILNGPMAVRPPGTALVLYPFGFKASVHSFLFRSVFAPILIWAIALSIPVATRVSCRWNALLGSALIIGLTTMPLFYQFERNEEFAKAYNVDNEWGMVDSLEGAIAALALSFLCVGIAKRSLKWCGIGWLVGAFSFFIKPSGLLVMMVLLGLATVEFVIQFLNSRPSRSAILKFAVPVYVTGFAVFGFTLWLAFGSEYMSPEVIAQSVKGQQFVLSLNQGRELFGMLALFIFPVFGWWWFCPGVVFTGFFVVEAAQSFARRRWSPVGMRIAAAGVILVSAVCWWIYLAGEEHRYLFPFLLMVIAWFVPEIFQRVREFGLSAKGAVIGYCLAPSGHSLLPLKCECPSI